MQAGVPESEAKSFREDESEDLTETKKLIREQARNEMDRVPYIVFGGIGEMTLCGAREVTDYVEALRRVAAHKL
ncbi:MAG: hypothetical protein M1818_004064 [Claussenomyces sp. TS43310]|nr:MAG: hypothetical protein M1818_004064 [Claussenomyces sp. TS43310]